jgi:phosphatidate cytidylyltransferase
MSEGNRAASSLTKWQIFLRRLVSFIVLWSAVLGAIFSGVKWLSDVVFLILMVLLAGFGLAEFYALVGKRDLVCFKGCGIIGGVVLMVFTFLYLTGTFGVHVAPAKANDFETGFLILFVLGLCVRQLFSARRTGGFLAISMTLLGLMYVPWLLNFIQKINYFPGIEDNGRYYVLYFILVTKLSDSGAYVVGSLIGRHQMVPRISPSKTWEGLGGALLAAALASLLCAHFAAAHLPGMNWRHAILLGLLLGGTAVVGDLVESQFKREAGVKDSGRFFPGIGGILDLLDSLLFNAPLMYLYLRHILSNEQFARLSG